MAILVKVLSPNDFDPDILSQHLIDFYKGYPWNEYLRCHNCGNPEMYDVTATYGFDNKATTCPSCGGQLELFWGPARSINYLDQAVKRPGFIGFKAVDESSGSLIGWVWGYDMYPFELSIPGFEGKGFYLDIICVLSDYRNYRPPIVGELYLNLLDYLMSDESYNYLITRTHKKASNVRRMLSMVGFMETGVVSKDDIQRDYLIRPLNEN